MYAEDEYDLAGFAVGLCDKNKIIDGSKVKEGDVVIGLASSGLHSNGYSLARKLFFDHLKLDIHSTVEGLEGTVGEVLLRPTRLYVKPVLGLMDAVEVKGVSNITGGGFIENIPRILSDDLNCTIEKGSWDKGDLFTFIENTGAIAEEELYRSFNMGIGMVLIVAKDEAEKALAYLNEKTDEKATVIGEITAGEGKTVLK